MEDESQACLALDESWAKIARAIQQRVGMLDRVLRVRVSSWLSKLHADGCATSKATWLRNRNAYAWLLLEQLRSGCIDVPFNSMPPDGVLPMLPTYLKYRYLPPSTKAAQQHETQLLQRAGSNSATAAGPGKSGVQRSARSVTAGASLTMMPSSMGSSHSSWRMAPSLTPVCPGSRPRHRVPASGSSSSSGPAPRANSSRRPRSPGAAGLLDAAAVLAAELDAEWEDAVALSSRLQFAEAKLLTQEAELTRLQGQAAATRRRLKCAAAGTLQELQERVGSSSGARLRSPAVSNSSPDVAEAMHGLLSGLQAVLDSCDREDREWQRAQGAAAAAAIERCYEEQEGTWVAAGASPAGDGTGTLAQRVAAQAADAATSEVAVLCRVQSRLSGLADAAGQLGTALLAKKDEATAAAGGQGGQRAADVAAAAAGLLDSMLGHLKAARSDTDKLRVRLAEAAQAAQAASDAAHGLAAAAREQHSAGSDADDASSTCSSADDGHQGGNVIRRPAGTGVQQRLVRDRHHQHAFAQACEQRGQQDARVLRLQAAERLLGEVDKAAGRLAGQLAEAQQKLLAALTSSSGSSSMQAAAAGQQHHDNGLLAAATAGVTASTAAGVRSLHACLANLQTEVQALQQGGTPSRVLSAAAARPLSRQHSSPVGAVPVTIAATAAAAVASPAAAFPATPPAPLVVASEAAAEAVHARLASLSRQASRMSARTSLLLAATPLSSSSTTTAAASPTGSPRPGSLLLGSGSGVGSLIGGGPLASSPRALLLSAPQLIGGTASSPPVASPSSRLLFAAPISSSGLGGTSMSALTGPPSPLLAVGSGSGRLLGSGLGMNTSTPLTSGATGSPLLAKGGLLAQSLLLSSASPPGVGSIGSSSSRIAAISSHLANLGRPAK